MVVAWGSSWSYNQLLKRTLIALAIPFWSWSQPLLQTTQKWLDSIPWYSISCCKIIFMHLVLEPDTSHREEGSGHAPTFMLSPWNAITRRMYMGTSNQWRYLITLVAPLKLPYPVRNEQWNLFISIQWIWLVTLAFSVGKTHMWVCSCCAASGTCVVWHSQLLSPLGPQSFPVLIRCFDTVTEFCCKVLLQWRNFQ